MLNRKFADLRHAPELDPRLVRYDPAGLPQAVVGIGPNASVKTKGGAVLARPGFTWAMFLFPGRWYAIASVYDARGQLIAHHVDLCVPPEERDGMLSFLDLKLDLLIRRCGVEDRLELVQDHSGRQRFGGVRAELGQRHARRAEDAPHAAHRPVEPVHPPFDRAPVFHRTCAFTSGQGR